MLPVVAGKRETKKQMLIYTLLLLPLSIAPAWLGIAGWIYGTVALALSLVFVAAAVAVWFDDSDRSAKRRSEEHTSELQSLMRISYAVFCLKKKKCSNNITNRCIHSNRR